MNRISNLIYFNNNRTTPIDESVTECMKMHLDSNEPENAVKEIAEARLGELLHSHPSELLFTSGTTGSINLLIKTAFDFYKHRGNHIITNVTEHFATLDCLKELELRGGKITRLGVSREGLVDIEELKAAIQPDTILVCMMAANNETGVVQPIEKISEICNEKEVLFFSDASQFAGKMRCDTKELGFGALAFGAHKMYGPDGIGLLYIDQKYAGLMNRIRETYRHNLSLPQIAGFGMAAEISLKNYWENSAHISRLKNYFEHHLLDLEGLTINGSTKNRLYNTSNLTFSDAGKISSLLTRFDFADNLKKPSYVLRAMGLSEEEIRNSFRFSFGKQNTLEEVKLFVEEIMY